MRWSVVIIICLSFVSTCLKAQRNRYGFVKGVVVDSIDSHVLESSSVRIYLVADSSLINYTLSDRKGEFSIDNIPFNTQCNLAVTIRGYKDFSRSFMLPSDNNEVRVDTIRLVKVYSELKSVIITAQRPPVVVKDDTLEFNASSFKTIPNAMLGDLLRQLPGVEVDKDGNITVNGKKVSKLLLDGQEFFGGDPKIAIRNLPRDIIDKLQVMDNKSHEAQFNLIKDGNEDLAINITLKKEAKHGWSGKASSGFGSRDRYEGNAIVNLFKGVKQFNIIGNANNTNNADWGSLTGKNFNISNPLSTLNSGAGGLTRGMSAGLNYSDNINRKLKVNGSYFFNSNYADNISFAIRKNILPDSAILNIIDNASGNGYSNHRFSFKIEHDIDSSTEIHVNSYFDSYISDGTVINRTSSMSSKEIPINNSENTYSSKETGENLNLDFFFSHRFKKSGRGITVGINSIYNNVTANDQNSGANTYYMDGAIDSVDIINQKGFAKNSGAIFSFATTYSEPVTKQIVALIRYNYKYNKSLSDKITNRFNSLTGKYDIQDSAYTNAFCNVTGVHNPAITLSFNNKQYRAAIGSGLQYLQQDNLSTATGPRLHRYFISFIPSANFWYTIGKTSSVFVSYNGYSQQPSIQQLQPVPDNSNPLYVQLSNLNLRPSFIHKLNLQVKESKAESFWFAGFNFNTTVNQIIEQTWFNDVGKVMSQPLNVNGNYEMSCNLQYSHTWKNKGSTFRMNAGSNGYYNRNNYFVNKSPISSNVYSILQSVGLNFTYRQLLNVISSFNIGINKTRYSSQAIQDIHYNNKSFLLSAFWNYPRWLIVESNLQYNYNSQVALSFNKSITMWSAALNCLILKRQQGMLRLAVYDILKQNSGVYRGVTQSYIEDRQTQVLQRYFLLSFIYNFKKGTD